LATEKFSSFFGVPSTSHNKAQESVEPVSISGRFAIGAKNNKKNKNIEKKQKNNELKKKKKKKKKKKIFIFFRIFFFASTISSAASVAVALARSARQAVVRSSAFACRRDGGAIRQGREPEPTKQLCSARPLGPDRRIRPGGVRE